MKVGRVNYIKGRLIVDSAQEIHRFEIGGNQIGVEEASMTGLTA